MYQPTIKSCSSCLMPFSKDPTSREHPHYCSYCFQNNTLCYTGNNLKEFQAICYRHMRNQGIAILPAKLYSFMIRFAPRWKSARR